MSWGWYLAGLATLPALYALYLTVGVIVLSLCDDQLPAPSCLVCGRLGESTRPLFRYVVLIRHRYGVARKQWHIDAVREARTVPTSRLIPDKTKEKTDE